MLDPLKINKCYPVSRIYLSPNKGGLEVERRSMLQGKPPERKRGKVMGLSGRSLHNLAFLATTSTVAFSSFVTLTYGQKYPTSGKESKAHLNRFLGWMRSQKWDEKIEYIWFLEFQRRNAPHYHILLSVKQPDKETRTAAAKAWCKIGATDGEEHKRMLAFHAYDECEEKRMWQAARSEDGLRRYAVKYACKPYQKKVPEGYQDVGRFWGASKGVQARKGEWTSAPINDEMLRKLLVDVGREDIADWEVLPKHIYLDPKKANIERWLS